MIERGIITALIALGLAAAISLIDVGRFFDIDFAPAPKCSAMQAETCG